MMNKALITGATGFIGFHLAKALAERGDQVTALVRKTSRVDRIEPLGVKLAYGDLDDPGSLSEAVAGQSVVYHLAGLVKARRTAEMYRANELGTENICRACAEQAHAPVLVVVSSLAAAGPAPKGRARVESDPARPVSHYGRTKRAAERAAEKYADRVPVTIVRPPMVFGEGDTACYQMFKAIKLTNIHFVPGYVPRHYSLIHAGDLADLLILAAHRGERLPAPGDADRLAAGQGCYFADSGEHPTYSELGRLIRRAIGRRYVILLPFGPVVIWSVAAVSDLLARLRGRSAYLSIDKAREATAGSWVCSGEKAARQLGFSVDVPLADRLRQTADWYRGEKWL